MADTETPTAREPVYFRLISGQPAMVWPSPDGDEAIIQIGRERPALVSENDDDSLSAVILDLLSRTSTIVSAAEWHEAMGTGAWPDGRKA